MTISKPEFIPNQIYQNLLTFPPSNPAQPGKYSDPISFLDKPAVFISGIIPRKRSLFAGNRTQRTYTLARDKAVITNTRITKHMANKESLIAILDATGREVHLLNLKSLLSSDRIFFFSYEIFFAVNHTGLLI